jgi:hypothetical protein
MPNARLLHLLMAFIGGTLLGSAARPWGTPMVILGGLFGGILGWTISRAIVRKLF